MNETELQAKINNITEQLKPIQAQLVPLQMQLNSLRETRKQVGLERVEEIRQQIIKLLDEAEDLTSDAGLTFYRETFIQGIDRNDPMGWNDKQYWQASDYC